MLKKICIIIIMMLLLAGLSVNVFAKDTYTTTTILNGVTVNWQYELNNSNQIVNLKCLNPADLLGDITIPDTLDEKNVISLKNDSFKGATNITGLTIPNTIKEISYNAFENCSELTNVNLGQIEKISFNVFKNCPKLTTITLPKTLKDGPGDVDYGVFTGTTNLTSVIFEDGTTTIAAGILKDCKGITSVEIPSLVTKVDCRAFQNSGITELTFSNALKDISYYAFNDCSNLNKITILDNCTQIGFFNINPTQDTVFQNHNDNLTIYCYEGSKIAEYAIATNIKYVYLTKPTTDIDTDEGEENLEETNQQLDTDGSQLPNNNQTDSTDTTTAKTELPDTGEKMIGLLIIMIMIIASIVFYVKSRQFKDV